MNSSIRIDRFFVEISGTTQRNTVMDNSTELTTTHGNNSQSSGLTPFFVLNFPKDLAFPIYGILVPIITILTLVSNVLVICVFMKKKMRSVTTMFLAGLAFSDTFSALLWCAVHLYFYGIKGDYSAPVKYPLCVFHDYALYLAVIFHATSVWLTTTLGVQRCIIVVKPFWGPRLWTIRKSFCITMMAYLLSFLFFLPLFLMNKYKEMSVTDGNNTFHFCVAGLRPFFRERFFEYSVVNYSFRGIFIQFLPCALMLVTTFVLAYKLKHGKILQRCISAAAEGPKKDFQHRQRTTLMVVIIMIIFLVVEIPNGVVFGIKLYEDLTNSTIIAQDVDYPIAILQNFILLLSYHCNFWIYVALSARFRNTLKSMICRFKVKHTFERMMTVSSLTPTNSLTRKRILRMHGSSNGNENHVQQSEYESRTYVSQCPTSWGHKTDQ